MLITLASAAGVMACSQGEKKSSDFKYLIDEFADIKIMRYQIPGWDNLSFKQKEYLYHLSAAAKFGWDIYWDQNCKDNLAVRKVLQNILENYKGDRSCKDFQDFTVGVSIVTTLRTNSSLSVERNTSSLSWKR